MTSLPHIPCLRQGRTYESLEKNEVKDHRTGEVKALVSSVNAGILRKDLARVAESRSALRKLSITELLAICSRASDLFERGTLPLGDRGHTQSPQQYIESLSATSGLPHSMVRRNMAKIASALANMPGVITGLTRGLPLEVVESGQGMVAGSPCSYYPVTQVLGVVMPSNSPAVNSLWVPAIALRIPVVIKPGREEPWTPYRLIQALITAGCPAAAFGFYPTDHEGAAEITRSCGRVLLFGDKTTTQQYQDNPAVQIHGPGFSKIVIGEDEIENWPRYLDLLTSSIIDNGGRSCINASAVVVPRYAKNIADALAEKLGAVQPLAAEDENARLSAFANSKMADLIHSAIEQDLKVPGATECTAKYRNTPRKVNFEGGTYLTPTIVLCSSFAHPLANREFLFPYASVVEIPQAEVLKQIGPSLVVTAITRNREFRQQLLESPLIERLNLGAIPTTHISWNQPHEGNLFEFLYRRRSLATEPV